MGIARSSRAASPSTRPRSEDPLNSSAFLTRAATKGGGGSPTQQHTLPMRGQGMEGVTPTRLHAPPARIQEME